MFDSPPLVENVRVRTQEHTLTRTAGAEAAATEQLRRGECIVVRENNSSIVVTAYRHAFEGYVDVRQVRQRRVYWWQQQVERVEAACVVGGASRSTSAGWASSKAAVLLP
jgi:hypothetical protein